MGKYIAIDDPSAYFQSTLYRGDSSNSTVITNTGNSNLQPDFIWIKSRNEGNAGTGGHMLFDSSRGIKSTTGSDSPFLVTNSESGDQTNANALQAVSTDSFKPGSMTRTNETGDTYVAWQWKGNSGTTASNSDGNIASTVQANTTSGFSIVTWTGDGSASGKNVGHGLGAVPKFIISKDRNGTSELPGWYAYHVNVGAEHQLQLTTNAIADSPLWGDTVPTSSVFSVGGEGIYLNTNQNNINYIAYVFTDVQGFSKFGAYKGNSSTDGTFVYTGFKPKWLVIKSTQANMQWDVFDSTISTSNVMDDYFGANVADPLGTSATKRVDFLSNGFKWRYNNNTNFSDHTYVYAAFAENPFVTSTGIMGTAR